MADIPLENIERELKRMKLHSMDDIMAEIGLGNAMSVVVARNLLIDNQQQEEHTHLSITNDETPKLPIKRG